MKVDYYINDKNKPSVIYKRIDGTDLYYLEQENSIWRPCSKIAGGYTDKSLSKAHWMKPISYEDLILEMI